MVNTKYVINVVLSAALLFTGLHRGWCITGGDEMNDRQIITEEQKASAKKVLRGYNFAALTSRDAAEIHAKFREIGIHGGPEEDELVKSSGFDPEVLKRLDPPVEKGKKDKRDKMRGGANDKTNTGDKDANYQGKYSIEQAVSDNAQLHTIAFSGLAFLTGDFGSATFIPPGKVCDFFGFQYMRDIDSEGKGHNPVFLNRVAGNIMHVLDQKQKKMFLDLAEEQAPGLEALAKMRLPLIKAFCNERDNRIPSGSEGLNLEAVKRYTGEIFTLDAGLSLRRAEVMAEVAQSLTSEQKKYLAKMKFGDFSTWPEIDERDSIKEAGRGRMKLFMVAYMTYASEFFSWTAGSAEADTYFCPERHGTYFGGFYMKDIRAMGKRDYDISTSVTGDSGSAFLGDILTAGQRRLIEEIPGLQKSQLSEIIRVRREISNELRLYLKGKTPDRIKVLTLGKRYGELDGELSWYYAKAFAGINRTLEDSQREKLKRLRNLDGYKSAGYYIFSEPVNGEPDMDKVEFLFHKP